MELSTSERQTVAAVLVAYAAEWARVERERPEIQFSPDGISKYLLGEAIVTLQRRNDVLGDV